MTVDPQNTLRQRLLRIIPITLAIVTAIVLAANIPDDRIIAGYVSELILYLLMTIITLQFGVLMSVGALSPAHSIGIIAFLSLPMIVTDSMTWAIFFGGLFGGLALLARARLNMDMRRRMPTGPLNVVFITTRVTISFAVAGYVYQLMGGILPLGRLPADMVPVVLPLTAYGVVYTVLYFAIFLLEVYVMGGSVVQVIRADLARIAAILLLPMPFAVLGAEVVNTLSIASRVVFMTGMGFIILALHALSLSEFQLRKQLNELRTLSVMTQAMRSHLDLDGLLRTIYVQIAHLLDIENFTVALYDLDEHRLNFPLVMRQGQEDPPTEARAVNYENTLIGYVLKSEAPLLISEDVDERARELHLAPPLEPVASWMGVPLLAGGRCLGVIVITSLDDNRHFTPDDLRLLNIVTASSSIAVENAQLYHQQTERAQQLITLNRVAALLSGTLSPDTVIDTVISSASTISRANAIAVYLFWDDARATLPLVRSAGFSEVFNTDPPDPISLHARTDPLQPPSAIVISDVATDRRTEAIRIILLREGISALIELPLVSGKDHLGVLVLHYYEPQVFTGDKVELLKTYAGQAAQAINNARTYATTDQAFQRSVEQLLALAGIGRLLTSTVDLATICDLVLGAATAAIKVDVGLVVLRDEVDGRWQILAARGYPDDFIKTFNPGRARSIVRRVLNSGQPARVDDVFSDPDYFKVLEPTRSMLCVPILRGRETLGCILLESGDYAGFSPENAHFVSQIANQAVIAIDNARLFARISEARDRLQVLLDAMEEGIMLIDHNGVIVLANPRIDLIGLTPNQVLDYRLKDLLDNSSLNLYEAAGFVSRDDALDIVDKMDALLSVPPVMYAVQGELGVLNIRRQLIPVRDAQGRNIGILMVFYNKTEEVELERSREEISRMIVHDLRSPLTAVTTSLKLIRDLVPVDVSTRATIIDTTDASRRALRKVLNRVDSLLDIARMESGQLNLDNDYTDLVQLVNSVRTELYPLAHELEVEIRNEVSPQVPTLYIDADKVERVVLNLVDNALKYSPSGTTISVRTHPPTDSFIRIDVADQGPGIPEEYKTRLFDSFVQIEGRRNVRRGVGLGLTFCRMVTEAYGGRIWIEDNPGGGTVFAFTLPVPTLQRLPGDQ